MAQRLVRAKRKIATARIPYRVPGRTICRTGWPACSRSSTSSSTRATGRRRATRSSASDLCAEAIRLGRLLAELMPDDAGGARAARADAAPRRAARRADRPDGGYVPLDRQDRAALGPPPRSTRARRCWTARCACVAPARTSCRPRSRRCTRRADADATDWPQIAALYGRLARSRRRRSWRSTARSPSPSRTGRRRGWRCSPRCSPTTRLAGYQPLHAAHAELLRRAGDTPRRPSPRTSRAIALTRERGGARGAAARGARRCARLGPRAACPRRLGRRRPSPPARRRSSRHVRLCARAATPATPRAARAGRSSSSSHSCAHRVLGRALAAADALDLVGDLAPDRRHHDDDEHRRRTAPR